MFILSLFSDLQMPSRKKRKTRDGMPEDTYFVESSTGTCHCVIVELRHAWEIKHVITSLINHESTYIDNIQLITVQLNNIFYSTMLLLALPTV